MCLQFPIYSVSGIVGVYAFLMLACAFVSPCVFLLDGMEWLLFVLFLFLFIYLFIYFCTKTVLLLKLLKRAVFNMQ